MTLPVSVKVSPSKLELSHLRILEYPKTDRRTAAIKCKYRCLFGISTRPKGYPGDNSVHGFHEGRSYFFTAGADNKLYFFVFQKNPRTTFYNEIPRYTQEDIDALVAECAKDALMPGVNFIEIYAQAKTAVMVPLQEYVLEKCFYKRSVLIGDSFHKVDALTYNAPTKLIVSDEPNSGSRWQHSLGISGCTR